MENKIFCQIRKKYVPKTPEELVRQMILKDLLANYNIPAHLIFAEKHLSKYGINTNKRADIVIDYNDKIKNFPLVIIECKSRHIPLTYKTHEQAVEYANITNAKLYGVTNGNETDFFIRGEDGDFKLLAGLPKYQDILHNTNLEYIESNPYFSYSDEDLEWEYISDTTPIMLKPFIKNLIKCFFNTDKKIQLPAKSMEQDKFLLLGDAGLREESNSNASGGSWGGSYRSMVVSTYGSELQVGLIILPGADDSTKLIVSCNGHNSLQLPLDDWALMRGDKVEIWHDGKITIGKSGSAPRDEMINMVRNFYPELVIRDHIFLGTLDNSKELTFENEDVKSFLTNIIKYVICRERFRNSKKHNTHK